jgi:peptide alpha-N-acetyltransferase
MKRPADQAKLLLFALLRSTATALATTGEKTRLILPQTHNIQLRLATRSDVSSIQRCNLECLPENYNSQFYCSHLRQWPDLALVAEHVEKEPLKSHPPQHRHPFPTFAPQPEPKIVAYVLGKVEARPCIDYDNPTSGEERVETLGHVTSLAVAKDFRRLGLAKAMMTQLHHHLQHQSVSSCGLHVRTSNEAACRLYQEDGYEIARIIPSYYQDGEDAYFMRKGLPAPSAAAAASPSMLFGKRIWRTGPEGLRLPRRHAIETEDDETASQSSSGSSASPELLTGTM